MRILSKKKQKEKLVLVFDVESSSVGGALFYIQKSANPIVIFTVREPIVLKENFEVDELLFATVKALDIVADKIYKAGLGSPNKIFCILSSPWHVSQTRIIKLQKNIPFIFTEKLADELIKKEIALFEEEHLKEYNSVFIKVRSIEIKNIKIMLNGYESPNPLNQKAKDLEMTIFISMSPEEVLQMIEKAIRAHFNFKDIKFSSSTMSSFAVVRDITKNEDFILMDIGGEITDISMIKKNILRESISYPLGSNLIIRGVASAFGSSLHEAKSAISLLNDGHAGIEKQKKLSMVLNKLKTRWLVKFQESLANISNDISVPATIYVAVDQILADFFHQTIEMEQFNQYTLTESKFKIIFFNLGLFHEMVTFKDNTVRDPALAIDVIYINNFLEKL